MTTHTYWASIGRNTNNGGRLVDADWDSFIRALRLDITQACGGTILGTVDGQGWWDGDSEATHLILFTIGADYVAPLRVRLQRLAQGYHQDAIGLVGGPGETLVNASA